MYDFYYSNAAPAKQEGAASDHSAPAKETKVCYNKIMMLLHFIRTHDSLKDIERK